MGMATIDIAGMQGLLAALETAVADLPRHKSSLSSIMDGVDVDPSPASGLDRVVAWGTGELTGLRRRLALAIHIESQNPSLNGVGVGVAEIDEAQISAVAPATAVQDGRDAAEKLKDAEGNPSDELLAAIQAGQNDPYFAQGFAGSITPEELSQVAMSLSDHGERVSGNTDVPDYAKSVDDWAKKYEAILAAVGTTVGTATRNTGDMALPSSYADEWSSTITEAMGGQGGSATPGQGAAAALFLRYGAYSTPFLDHVAGTVYDYEQDHKDEGPVWLPRSQINGNYQGPLAPDGKQAYDPLASVLFALGHNPEAAQNFFVNGGYEPQKIHGQDVNVFSRLTYLLHDRQWPTEDGDGLGQAIDAATTTFRDDPSIPDDDGYRGQMSAVIASETMALLGDKIGDGGNFTNNGYQVPQGMRDSIANMLAAYMPDVYRVTNDIHEQGDRPGPEGWTNQGYPDGYPPGLPVGMTLNYGDLSKVMQSLGRSDDKNAVSGVVAAGVQFQTQLTDTGLAEYRRLHPDAPLTMGDLRTSPDKDLVEKPGILGGTALNFLVVAGFQGGDKEQKMDAANNARLAQVFDVATSFVPGPTNKVVNVMYGQAKSWTSGAIKAPPKDKATAWAEDTDGSVTRSLELNFYQSLMAQGYLDPAHDDRGGVPAAATVVVGGQRQFAPGVLKGEGDDAAQDAFDDWYQSGAPRDIVEPFYLAPYKTRFKPNYG